MKRHVKKVTMSKKRFAVLSIGYFKKYIFVGWSDHVKNKFVGLSDYVKAGLCTT